MNNNNPTLGIFSHTYEWSELITKKELETLINEDSYYQLDDYYDRRKTTNLTRFNFDPYTGEKINWNHFKHENQKKKNINIFT